METKLANRNLVFSLKEYKRRLDEIKKRMVEQDLDLVMITDPANLTYLTGHQTSGYDQFQALFIPLHKEPFMITRLLEESNISERTWVKKSRSFSDIQDPIQILIDTFNEFNLSHLVMGIEKRNYFLPYTMQERIESSLSTIKIVDCSGIVELSRMVKSNEEIELMKKAAHVTQEGMKAGLAEIKVGIFENDIAAAVHNGMYRAGGEYPSVPPYITSGPRTNIGHATWEGRKLCENDCLFIEIGGCIKRYHTAMMRTVFLGKAPKELLEMEKITNEAIDVAMSKMKPGVQACEIDRICKLICMKRPKGSTQVSRSGYSIGIAFAPSWDEGQIISLKETESRKLMENMTFHLIPWLQFPSKNMVMALSETVYVTKSGARSFFDMKRELIEY